MPKRELSRSRSRSRSTKRIRNTNQHSPNRAAPNPNARRLTMEELMLRYPQQINPRPAENVARLLGDSMRRLTRDPGGPTGGSSRKHKRRSLKQKRRK